MNGLEAAAPAPESEADAIFGALLAERGGADRLSAAQLPICRALAVALTTAAPHAPTISALTSLLPAPGASAAKARAKLNFDALSLLELAEIERLLMIAETGDERKGKRAQRRHGRRECAAISLASLLARGTLGRPSAGDYEFVARVVAVATRVFAGSGLSVSIQRPAPPPPKPKPANVIELPRPRRGRRSN